MDEPLEVGPWTRISVLGSGGFGIVTLWQQRQTDEYIALKKCKFQMANALTERQKQRWENEVKVMKSLNHPNIVGSKTLPNEFHTILHKYNPTGLPLLTMEYCKRGNLRHVLNQVRNVNGLEESDVRQVLHDVTKGLAYLHKYNITHRDIKPENIVLQECVDPNKVIYKIIDLGYAKELSDSTVSFVGTLHYLAPEIIKAENYNHSVDYWSLGVLVFEAICGQLPFLPQFTPVERYQYIEKKKPEHICIYQSQSGSVIYSSELFKQNQISSSLKQNIEIWLRHVLNVDSGPRSVPFPGQTGVFQYLINVLNKRIVKVFSVYTMEFYSYEINDGTLISTLKNWIARDTKVQINEQILLTNGQKYELRNDMYVKDCIQDNDTIFVYKNGAYINRYSFSLPKNIQKLFDKVSLTYKWRDIRPTYSKALFYLTQEKKLINHLVQALKLLLEYLDSLNRRLKQRVQEVYKSSSNLMVKVSCYYNIQVYDFSDLVMPNAKKFQDCVVNFKVLAEHLAEVTAKTNDLLKKYPIPLKRKQILDKLLNKIVPVLKNSDINDQISGAIALMAKGSGLNEDVPLKFIAKIVSDAIRKKDKLLNNNNFQHYAKAAAVAINECLSVLEWIDTFQIYLAQFSEVIDENQKTQQSLLIASIKRKNECIDDTLDANLLIEENRELRCKLEETLTKLFIDLKNITL